MSIFRSKTNWVHIEFWFDKNWSRYHELESKEKKSLKRLLLIIINRMHPFIIKRFYLFEPNPHLFLAMKLQDRNDLGSVKKVFEDIKNCYLQNHKFIKKIELRPDTRDHENRKGFIEVLDAMTTYNLIHKDNSLTHIIHCSMNNSFYNRIEENEFYKTMYEVYL